MSLQPHMHTKNQTGLTIIELMISLLLSSLLLLGILQLFINSNASDHANSSLARLQENGRIALDIIKQDLRRTSYQGCASPTTPSRTNSLYSFPTDAMGKSGTETLEGAGTASDTLVMRHASPLLMRATNIGSTSITFITAATTSFTAGTRYEFILTNCEEIAIFSGVASAKSNNPDAATNVLMPDKYTLSSLQGANNGPPPSFYGFPTGAGSQFLRLSTNTYAVQQDPANDPENNGGRPTLYKNGAPLIADVDNFQVLYGVNSGGQISWINGSNPTNAQRQTINRLQISLVISSPDNVTDAINTQAFTIANIGGNTQLPAIQDRHLRRQFSTIVDVRNRP